QSNTPAESLNIQFTGIKEVKGSVYLKVVDAKEKVVAQKVVEIQSTQVVVTLELPKGAYAVSAFHDINNNGKLDTNPFGIPKEPYGFSNNARGIFGPPSLADQLIQLEGKKNIVIGLK
ncbi:DUF2141 domain-containing protein, partial [Arthrospira platensis SPKY1]|nr:DUF2141 domain-containing protein [Arthrospira platensis SPKY1]